MAKLYFRYASMRSGKSTALLQVAHNYESLGMGVQLFTSSLDDRSGSCGVIASRLGISRSALTFDDGTVFDDLLIKDGVACVLIDEAQFLSANQVRQLHRFVHTRSVPVIAYGLRSDFKANPFPGAAMLLTLADSLEELKTVCGCSKKATLNIRVDPFGHRVTVGKQVLIGGDDSYRSVCPSCFYRD